MFNVAKHIHDGVRQFLDDVQSVFDRDPAARSTAEVMLTYPGIHALAFHRVAHPLWEHDHKTAARVLASVSRFLTGIEIHPAAQIGQRFFIDHGMGVVIGETVKIGNDVTLYQGVTLGGTSLAKGKRHPTLEDGVIVGAGAKVLGPFTVGQNAKIGSNAVVTKPVPAGATAVGSTARLIIPEDRRNEHLGFSDHPTLPDFAPYGTQPNLPDPVANAFNTVLDHLKATDHRLDTMATALCKLNPSFCDEKPDGLEPKDFAAFNPKPSKCCGGC